MKTTAPAGDDRRDYDLLLKIILIGDSGTGKSSLMTRLIKNEFIFGRVSTIGIDFLPKTITIDSRVIKALFWDTGGQERFRSITPNYYLGAHGAFLVYDVTERSSYDNLTRWLHDIHQHANPNVVVMIIGNKCDLNHERQVSTEEAVEFSRERGLAFIETSAKDATGVNEAFLQVVTEMYERRSVLLPVDDRGGVPIGQPVRNQRRNGAVEEDRGCC